MAVLCSPLLNFFKLLGGRELAEFGGAVTLLGQYCVMLGLCLETSLKCCFDGAVSLKAEPPCNWSTPFKRVDDIEQA